MKWKFEVNGEIKLVLTAESQLSVTLLFEMADLSAKGRAFRIVLVGDSFVIEPIEYRPAPVENPTI